jgi:hypothetical protein
VTDRHVTWTKGGEARVAALGNDSILLRSTAPFPPGSRIEGRLEGEPLATLRVKVHASRLQPEGDFAIEGRLLDATRDLRARLETLVRGTATSVSAAPHQEHKPE